MNIWIMNHYAIEHFYEKGGRHYWIANELKKMGHTPTVFGCNERHNTNQQLYPDKRVWHEEHSESGITFVPINSTPYMGNGISRVKNMVVFAENLKKTAKQYAKLYGKPDVIYASSVHPLTVIAGEDLARHFGVPCIGEVRDLWPETLVAYGSVKKNSLLAKILYQGEKYMYKRADAMIFTMEGAPDYIREHRWDKENGGPIDLNRVFHVCNGVDIEQFDNNAKSFQLADEDLDDKDTFCAVYTGAIKRANNVGLLLDTAKYLKDISNIRILIWGEGNEVEGLRKRIKEENLEKIVKIKGYVEKKYIASICTRADICLMHWERTSVNNYGYDYNKLFDYLASGKVVFSTIQSGHSLLENKHCGIETAGNTPKDFADGIRKIYEMSAEEREEWGKRARKAAFDYDFKNLTKTVEEVIQKVTSIS